MKAPRRTSLAVAIAAGLWSRHGFAADAPAPDAPTSAAPPTEAPASPAPAEPRSDSQPHEPTQREPGRSSRTLRTLGWVSLALGAEAGVVASVTSFMLLHEKTVRDEECNAQKLCSPRGLDASGTIATLVPVNTVSWIVMGAGLVGGAYLLLTNRPDAKVSTTVAVTPSPRGVGIALHGAF